MVLNQNQLLLKSYISQSQSPTDDKTRYNINNILPNTVLNRTCLMHALNNKKWLASFCCRIVFVVPIYYFMWSLLNVLVWIPQCRVFSASDFSFTSLLFPFCTSMNKLNICSRYIYGIIISPSVLQWLSLTSLYLSSCFCLSPSLSVHQSL